MAICDQTLGCASDGVSRFGRFEPNGRRLRNRPQNWGKRFTAGVSQLGEPIPLAHGLQWAHATGHTAALYPPAPPRRGLLLLLIPGVHSNPRALARKRVEIGVRPRRTAAAHSRVVQKDQQP